MTIFIVALVAWWVAGWKIGAALAIGCLLESIEAIVLYRGLLKLRRENAELAGLLNTVASDLETAVSEVDSYLGSDSQMVQE